MSITLHPELEMQLRSRADAEGLTVEIYLEQLVRADDLDGAHIDAHTLNDLHMLALEGLQSGEPIAADAAFWEHKHRMLEEFIRLSPAR